MSNYKIDEQKKRSMIVTFGTIILIVIILMIYFFREKHTGNNGIPLENEEIITGMEEETFGAGSDLDKKATIPVFHPEEAVDISFLEKNAEELYEEVFTVKEQETEYVHFYIEEGTLYLDEYVQTDEQDEEGIYIYEWHRKEKIAEDVICVDYNWYHMEPNALYITKDHVLHGTGEYEDIYLENIKYASTYADQMLALTLDGNLWCRGVAHSISDGRSLEYRGWELVMQEVAYAQLAHYRFMAITKDGSLYMWGDNTLGQFGDGSLLTDDSLFQADCYFYLEPIKVADNIKMVWEKYPGQPKQTEEYGDLRTYFLTTDNELFVSGENVGSENRSYTYYGELGWVDEPYQVNCTSVLHKVMMEES